jgi:hypothetical protein
MELTEEIFWRYHGQRREDNQWDYKRDLSIATNDEFAEVAKDILAFANYGGGYMLLGIDNDTHELKGVSKEIDPAALGDKFEKNTGVSIEVKLFYFSFGEGNEEVRLGIVYVPPGDKVLVPTRVLQGSNGKTIVHEAKIYYRRSTRSVGALGDDIDRIVKRVYEHKTGNPLSIHHEESRLSRLSSALQHLDFMSVLRGDYDPSAKSFGHKLKEIWQYQTKYSKTEFARLLRIPPKEIDEYFEGRMILDVSQLIAAARMFDLRTDYFFVPTYDMRPPYWMEDMVKYAILSLVRPKSAIRTIDNAGPFYASVLNALARGICAFHEFLYYPDDGGSAPYQPTFLETEWPLNQVISPELKSDLAKQYYKLLEQYPPQETKRTLTTNERVLKSWFFASDEYIARIIIEGIESIRITRDRRAAVKLRFMEDIRRNRVRFCGFKEDSLRMSRR